MSLKHKNLPLKPQSPKVILYFLISSSKTALSYIDKKSLI